MASRLLLTALGVRHYMLRAVCEANDKEGSSPCLPSLPPVWSGPQDAKHCLYWLSLVGQIGCFKKKKFGTLRLAIEWALIVDINAKLWSFFPCCDISPSRYHLPPEKYILFATSHYIPT